MGHSGKWFAFQYEDCLSDVLTIAKALGNGIPLSTCLVGFEAGDLFQPGQNGPTLGGNQLSCVLRQQY